MGEWADYYIDLALSECFREPRPRGFQYGVGFGRWKDSKGKVVNMKDMDDRYLNNCLNLCVKRGNTGKAQEIRAEFQRRSKAPLDKPYDQGVW